VAAAKQQGIVVTNTPHCLHEATADLTWGLILGAGRRIVEGDRMVRRGEWKVLSNTQICVYPMTALFFSVSKRSACRFLRRFIC